MDFILKFCFKCLEQQKSVNIQYYHYITSAAMQGNIIVPTYTMDNTLCRHPSKFSCACADSIMKISPTQIHMPEELLMEQIFDHE